MHCTEVHGIGRIQHGLDGLPSYVERKGNNSIGLFPSRLFVRCSDGYVRLGVLTHALPHSSRWSASGGLPQLGVLCAGD